MFNILEFVIVDHEVHECSRLPAFLHILLITLGTFQGVSLCNNVLLAVPEKGHYKNPFIGRFGRKTH